jgi:hypothetical protein
LDRELSRLVRLERSIHRAGDPGDGADAGKAAGPASAAVAATTGPGDTRGLDLLA